MRKFWNSIRIIVFSTCCLFYFNISSYSEELSVLDIKLGDNIESSMKKIKNISQKVVDEKEFIDKSGKKIIIVSGYLLTFNNNDADERIYLLEDKINNEGLIGIVRSVGYKSGSERQTNQLIEKLITKFGTPKYIQKDLPNVKKMMIYAKDNWVPKDFSSNSALKTYYFALRDNITFAARDGKPWKVPDNADLGTALLVDFVTRPPDNELATGVIFALVNTEKYKKNIEFYIKLYNETIANQSNQVTDQAKKREINL